MNRWPIVLLICLLQFSCSSKDKIKLISRKELIPLLIDLNIADAISSNSQFTNQLGGVDSAVFYSSIYKKHNHTKEELDKTLNYYSNRPKKLTEIYDAVFAEMSKRSEAIKAIEGTYTSRTNKCIWKSSKKVFIEGDTVSYPADTDLRIDSIGNYLISVTLKMGKND
jgi:hypothetical protein